MYVINGIVYADSEADSVTVKDAKALDGMIMVVTFSNGERRLFDATALKGEVFEPLKNNDVFREFKIEFGTITWEDGEKYEIDRVSQICQAAAMKAGGQGDRYTIWIRNRQSYLFFERSTNLTGNNIGRWFVERRES